ncbi:hypothetical protein LTR36_003158 [Oleoguttula mirabilis]|uniref:Uncharacterized protein n=1 Tax=Oleoguttula mirabilis TaxID=1507867 RepID=A0AAV9JYG6_9PEZI|nr:hypothetical protein LTR36_003158 [Oleoguttula mirabilis]
MAVPASVTTKDMSGTYTLNKTLSDSSQAVLKMQNIGFIVRQAAQYSTVTATLKQYTDDRGVVHLDQDQVSTGGIRNIEERTLDGVSGERTNSIWGKVRGVTRLTKLSELEDDYLKEGWSQDCIDGDLIYSVNESDTNGWRAVQVYGFADVGGERKHVRRVVTTKGEQVEKIRLVYDWKV